MKSAEIFDAKWPIFGGKLLTFMFGQDVTAQPLNITLFSHAAEECGVHKCYCQIPLCEKKKNVFLALLFVDFQYKKAVMAVSTSHVACSHPANCEYEKTH